MLEHIIDFIAYTLSIFFGEGDGLLYALVLFVLLDYATGICDAIYHHRLSSSIGAKGIAKKAIIFLAGSVAHVTDQYLMDANNVLRNVTLFFYLSNECISIFENVGRLGIPLPTQLEGALKYLKKKS